MTRPNPEFDLERWQKHGNYSGELDATPRGECLYVKWKCPADGGVHPDAISDLKQLVEAFPLFVLNISTMSFLPSDRLSVYLTLNRLAKKSGGCFVLSGADSTADRILRFAKLDTQIAMAKNDRAAEMLVMEHRQSQMGGEI